MNGRNERRTLLGLAIFLGTLAVALVMMGSMVAQSGAPTLASGIPGGKERSGPQGGPVGARPGLPPTAVSPGITYGMTSCLAYPQYLTTCSTLSAMYQWQVSSSGITVYTSGGTPVQLCPSSQWNCYSTGQVDNFLNSLAGLGSGNPQGIPLGTMLWAATSYYTPYMELLDLGILGDEMSFSTSAADPMQDLAPGYCGLPAGVAGGTQTPASWMITVATDWQLVPCSLAWDQWMSIAAGTAYLYYWVTQLGTFNPLFLGPAYNAGGLKPYTVRCPNPLYGTIGSQAFGMCMTGAYDFNVADAYNAAIGAMYSSGVGLQADFTGGFWSSGQGGLGSSIACGSQVPAYTPIWLTGFPAYGSDDFYWVTWTVEIFSYSTGLTTQYTNQGYLWVEDTDVEVESSTPALIWGYVTYSDAMTGATATAYGPCWY